MDIKELRQKSNTKVLLRGKSGRGKTKTCCDIVIELLNDGMDVLYVDTESEGANTLVNKIDSDGLDEDIVSNLEYIQISSYQELEDVLGKQSSYDLMVIDTLDHKHTMALKGVTDAKRKSDADWNQYPQIYSAEKEIMDKIGNPKTNIIATLDPDSGKIDKPKGTQTNIHGYFGIVIDLQKSGDEWTNKIVNWVGRSDIIGASADNLVEAISAEIKERVE